jgi:DNA mismatch repair ATPase MutS
MNEMIQKVIEKYIQEISLIHSEIIQHEKTERRLSFTRLITAIIGTAVVILAFQSSITLGILSIIFFGVIFFIIFIKHEKAKEEIALLSTRKSIQENEINTLSTHHNMYSDGEKYARPSHDYTDDLDVFGKNSLFSLTNRCASLWGKDELADIFSTLPRRSEILDRQESIKELAGMKSWRDDLLSRMWLIESKSDEDLLKKIRSLTAQDYYILNTPYIYIGIWVVPLFWTLIIVLNFFSIPFLGTIALGGAIAIFTIYLRYANKVNQIHHSISTGKNYLSDYIEIFHMIYNHHWNTPYLKKLVEKEKGESQIVALNKLNGLINKLDYRLNMIVGFILNLSVFWDFRILKQLQAWSEEYEDNITDLFNTLGKIEALTSLSIWAYNHPHHIIASIKEDNNYTMKDIRHPLMLPDQCVPNDFLLTEDDHINIITGSNMSGKSTILRTIGVNLILAYSGTAVDASEFSVPVVRVITYMRIKDALEESVSTFKAELNRVKVILDSLKDGNRCLYLVDEMLRGTNSKDKLKGSIAITRKILHHKGYAIIATHDIQLAELGHQYPDHFKNYYFDIEFDEEDLVFDYKLKKGICSNFNASHLLKQIGVE